MTKIKVCGLTRPEDARAAVQAGVDAIGLVFAPSPRQVMLAQAQAIIRVLPFSLLRFGVFADQTFNQIINIFQQLGLDRIQLHGKPSARLFQQIPPGCGIYVLHPGPETPRPRKDPAPYASTYLIDTQVAGQVGGTGKVGNWNYARGLKRFHKPIILSGGLNARNVAAAIQHVHPDMVDVSTGVETSPGIKSAAKIRAFVRAVRGGA